MNRDRIADWDVDAQLAGVPPGHLRKLRMNELTAEFQAACCTKLRPDEQKRLQAEIATGAYDEPGPRLRVLNTANDDTLRG
jgi:hypothetical protein